MPCLIFTLSRLSSLFLMLSPKLKKIFWTVTGLSMSVAVRSQLQFFKIVSGSVSVAVSFSLSLSSLFVTLFLHFFILFSFVFTLSFSFSLSLPLSFYISLSLHPSFTHTHTLCLSPHSEIQKSLYRIVLTQALVV